MVNIDKLKPGMKVRCIVHNDGHAGTSFIAEDVRNLYNKVLVIRRLVTDGSSYPIRTIDENNSEYDECLWAEHELAYANGTLTERLEAIRNA